MDRLDPQHDRQRGKIRAPTTLEVWLTLTKQQYRYYSSSRRLELLKHVIFFMFQAESAKLCHIDTFEFQLQFQWSEKCASLIRWRGIWLPFIPSFGRIVRACVTRKPRPCIRTYTSATHLTEFNAGGELCMPGHSTLNSVRLDVEWSTPTSKICASIQLSRADKVTEVITSVPRNHNWSSVNLRWYQAFWSFISDAITYSLTSHSGPQSRTPFKGLINHNQYGFHKFF